MFEFLLGVMFQHSTKQLLNLEDEFAYMSMDELLLSRNRKEQWFHKKDCTFLIIGHSSRNFPDSQGMLGTTG